MPEHKAPNNADERTKRFLRLLAEHERTLRAYVLSLVRNWNDAEDLVQETRIRLWEQFDTYDESKDFGVWARTIAYYQALTFRKRASRDQERFTTAFMESVAEELERQASELDLRHAALQACLEKLDRAKRAVLMRYYEGTETMRQIAESQGRPIEGLRKTLQRTRLALSRCVEVTMGANS